MTLQKIDANSPEAQSADLLADNIAQLKMLFPELVTEGAHGTVVNVDVLKALVGDATVTDADEKYGLNWYGKRRARQMALTPSTGTLRPCPEDSVNWDSTQNLMIEGDNLEVLKLLQKSYSGKVKLIYIDPPYNTGKDFVYPDSFQDSVKNYLELTGQVEGGQKTSSNTEASGRFHTDWLNMIYPRLRLARNLLSDDGVIFVSIDDGEIGNLLAVMNEIFGEENFKANISWQKRYTRSNNTVDFTTVVEHIAVYSKSDLFSVNLLERTKEADARYTNPDNDPRGPWKGASILNPATPQQRPGLCYPITNPNTGSITYPTKNAWRRSQQEFERLAAEGRLYWGVDGKQSLPSIKMYLSEAREITPINFWEHGYAGNTDDGTKDMLELFGEKVFDNPKPVRLIQRVLEHGSDKDSIILDFFAGSGTTAHAVMAQNAADGGARRFILVQLPERVDQSEKSQGIAANFCKKIGAPLTIAEITKERIRRAGKHYMNESGLFSGDVGFKSFKLDKSNITAWKPGVDSVESGLFAAVQHVLPGRSDLDILYEIALRFGIDICTPVGKRSCEDLNLYEIGGGVIFACLSPGIESDQVEIVANELTSWANELKPIISPTCIFLDSSFRDDVSKLNMVAILEQHGFVRIISV